MTKRPMRTEEEPADDLAYLLRLWRMGGEGAAGWRASLTSPDSGERHGFASLENLFVFLRRRTATESDANDAEERRQ